MCPDRLLESGVRFPNEAVCDKHLALTACVKICVVRDLNPWMVVIPLDRASPKVSGLLI